MLNETFKLDIHADVVCGRGKGAMCMHARQAMGPLMRPHHVYSIIHYIYVHIIYMNGIVIYYIHVSTGVFDRKCQTHLCCL